MNVIDSKEDEIMGCCEDSKQPSSSMICGEILG
jgi:hypothetical protein